jgi:hypothetical protein
MQQIIKVPVSSLQLNNGQIEGVPKNPRFIKDDSFAKLVESLRSLPKMTEIKPLWIYNNVVISGNMRLRAARELKWKEIPVIILPPETTKEELCAYAILDNTHYGDHDWDILANEWSDCPLSLWGLSNEYISDELEERGNNNKKSNKKEIEVTCPICNHNFKINENKR